MVAVDVGAVEVQGFVTLLVPADLDNTLYEVNEFVLEENSNGAGHYLFAGVTDQGDLRRGLLHFDVAAAITTENTRIVSAHLQMNMSRTPFGAGPQDILLHRTLAEWGEGDSDATGEEGQGAPASVGEATWLNRMYPNRPWAVPGGEFESAPIAAATVDDVGFYTWESQDLLRTVQNWRDDPDSNYGLTVVGNEAETRTTKRFDSGEHPFLQNRPQLVLLVTGGAFSDLAGAKVTSVLLNRTHQDPPDRPAGPQPTSWAQQRSDIRDIQITFSEDVNIDVADIQLFNLGVNAPLDPDTQIPLTPAHLSVAGSVATLSFGHAELPIGVYELRIAPTVTTMLNVPLDGNNDGVPGDEFLIRADRFNRFYKMTADFNGDLGTSVFDFGTFAYWFGSPVFPAYVDLNNDGGASVFDFPLFAQFFGRGVVLPPPPFASLSATQPISPLAGLLQDAGPSQLESPALESPAQQRAAAVELVLFADLRPRRTQEATAQGDRERPPHDDLEHILDDLAPDVNAIWRRGR